MEKNIQSEFRCVSLNRLLAFTWSITIYKVMLSFKTKNKIPTITIVIMKNKETNVQMNKQTKTYITIYGYSFSKDNSSSIYVQRVVRENCVYTTEKSGECYNTMWIGQLLSQKYNGSYLNLGTYITNWFFHVHVLSN